MNIFHPISLSNWFKAWITALIFFALSVVLNVSVGMALGSLIGWLFGGSISAGLGLIGPRIPSGEIYKIGALVGIFTGFFATFLRFVPIIKIREN